MNKSLKPTRELKSAQDNDGAVTYRAANARSALLPALNGMNDTADRLAASAFDAVAVKW